MKYGPFKQLLDSAQKIVIIQADNPDGDSLASSLAIEEVLSMAGKQVVMYCGVEIPGYLRYMNGWERVVHDLPNQFDLSIVVDTSALTLLETLQKSNQLGWIKAKPCAVIDHHATEQTIDFARVSIIEEAVSTGELLMMIFNDLEIEISQTAAEFLAYSILSDTLGLTGESVSSQTFKHMAELLDRGVSIAKLDDARRSLNKKSSRILEYKGSLLQRVLYSEDGRVAYIIIPWEEIERYSHEYNPSILVLDEMRMVENVQAAIAFKTYPDGKITAKIRTNYGYPVANKIAENFGGGGHSYASGFKITNGKNLETVKSDCIAFANKLVTEIQDNSADETIQYSF